MQHVCKSVILIAVEAFSERTTVLEKILKLLNYWILWGIYDTSMYSSAVGRMYIPVYMKNTKLPAQTELPVF